MANVRIKMIRNQVVSPDGVSVCHYEADKEYTVPAELADVLKLHGNAVDATTKSKEPEKAV
ncbi:hypothetical protein [Methylopila sp. 73B]|uniref:hypothetical protein n=1 Tax=Methylopila sp. 73B TaxID=1120792 RepID=UPI0018CC0216|nr:hypothetical protein [Methylopila sp. 73B]